MNGEVKMSIAEAVSIANEFQVSLEYLLEDIHIRCQHHRQMKNGCCTKNSDKWMKMKLRNI